MTADTMLCNAVRTSLCFQQVGALKRGSWTICLPTVSLRSIRTLCEQGHLHQRDCV